MKFLRSLGLVVGLTLLGAATLSAQTTGSIVGRVIDESGAPLAGATVEATSPSLQGTRTASADANGDYRLTLLPPGIYEVKLTLQGFAGENRTNIAVSLDKATTLDVALRVTASDEITVTGDARVIDSTSTTLGTSLDIRAIQTLPTARNYAAVAQVTPGIASDANPDNQDQSTISVYGSSGAENVFYIDGVNTTGLEYGFQGTELNFEFIEAVDVKTGGYQAEFGRATGGVVNVITKSGGNELHGDLFGYFDDDSLQSSADSVVSTSGTPEGFTKEDYGIGLGGFLKKDKLWFFAAYDKVSNTATTGLPAGGPQEGEKVDSDSDRDLAAAKLTLRLTESQSLIGSFFQDPRQDTGAINDQSHSLNGDPSTYTGQVDRGGKDYALRYQGILGSDWVVTGQVARHNEESSIGPATAAGDAVQFRDVDRDFLQTGGFGLIQNKEFQRDHLGLSAARYLGRHEIKGGLEYEKEKADVVRRQSGGQQVDIFSNPFDPNRPIYQHHYWTTPDATIANAPLSQLTAAPEHKNTTVYLQDGWSVRSNLTLNLGVRWDRQQIVDAAGTQQIDLQDDYAPRLGFIWDPTADNRSKVFGSYGRYYEQLPMDLVIRSFSFERQPRIVNFSPTDIHPDAAAEGILGTDSAILGGFTEPSDPNIKGQYLTEVLLGGEREVLPDVAVGAKLIFRKYDRVIEDFLCADDGTYCIGNPGEGIFKQVFTLDYSRTLPAPKPKREYKGVQLDVTKRFSKNWQALASYLYSKLDGNFDGEYAPFTNVGADPNISAAYDYFDFFTNGSDLTRITNKGPLSNERRHQFKLSGLYLTPWKLQVGASAYYRSGTPLTRYGYSDAYGRYEFFLTPRGGEGRGPASYEADLHFGYPVKAGPTTINLLLDVFNALNAQKPILLDQRWGFQESDNALPNPTNPGYKRPVLRTAPTSFRVGVRVSF